MRLLKLYIRFESLVYLLEIPRKDYMNLRWTTLSDSYQLVHCMAYMALIVSMITKSFESGCLMRDYWLFMLVWF